MHDIISRATDVAGALYEHALRPVAVALAASLPDNNQTAAFKTHLHTHMKSAAKTATKHLRAGSHVAAAHLTNATGLGESVTSEVEEVVFVLSLILLAVCGLRLLRHLLCRCCCCDNHQASSHKNVRYAGVGSRTARAASAVDDGDEDDNDYESQPGDTMFHRL